MSICNSLLKVVLGFRSIEKGKLLSFIVGGCVRTRRVMRWAAFGLLLSRSSLSLSEVRARIPFRGTALTTTPGPFFETSTLGGGGGSPGPK